MRSAPPRAPRPIAARLPASCRYPPSAASDAASATPARAAASSVAIASGKPPGVSIQLGQAVVGHDEVRARGDDLLQQCARPRLAALPSSPPAHRRAGCEGRSSVFGSSAARCRCAPAARRGADDIAERSQPLLGVAIDRRGVEPGRRIGASPSKRFASVPAASVRCWNRFTSSARVGGQIVQLGDRQIDRT